MEKNSKQRKKPQGRNVKGRKCSLALKVGGMVLMIITTGIPIYFIYLALTNDCETSGRDTMAHKIGVLIKYLIIGTMAFMGFSGAAVFGTLQFIGARKRLDKDPKHDFNTTLKILRFCQAYPMLLLLLGIVGLSIGYFNNIRVCWLAYFDIISLAIFLGILAIESGREIEMLEKEKRILEFENQNAKLSVNEQVSSV